MQSYVRKIKRKKGNKFRSTYISCSKFICFKWKSSRKLSRIEFQTIKYLSLIKIKVVTLRGLFLVSMLGAQKLQLNFKTRFRRNYHLFTGRVIYRCSLAHERISRWFIHAPVYATLKYEKWCILRGLMVHPLFPTRVVRAPRRIILENDDAIGRYILKRKISSLRVVEESWHKRAKLSRK